MASSSIFETFRTKISGQHLKPHWPRSRYWLNHFLNIRHFRPASLKNLSLPSSDPSTITSQRLYASAEIFQQSDPAFAQSLRLFSKALPLHQAAFKKHAQANPSSIQHVWVRQKLSLRFELALQFVQACIDDIYLTAAIKAAEFKAAEFRAAEFTPYTQALHTLKVEREGHMAFLCERLTFEFAKINFFRRNLRRAILRGMFYICWHSRRNDYLMDLPVNRLTIPFTSTRKYFENRLKRLIPYRREEILKGIRQQEQQPFQPYT